MTTGPAANVAAAVATPGPQHVTEAPPDMAQLASESNALITKVLDDTRHAEEEDHRRVASHHDFIRQQTQQAVQLQHGQTSEFLRQYLAENKRQLDAHLHRLRFGLAFGAAHGAGDGDGDRDEESESVRNTVVGLEKKVGRLERKLEDREGQLAQYSALVVALEDQHREELRGLRARQDEAQQRTLQTNHEYVVSLLADHEAVRRQYEEALAGLRDAVSAKSSLEAVRGTVEQSAREFAMWRGELEQKHDAAVRERDSQLQAKERQIQGKQ